MVIIVIIIITIIILVILIVVLLSVIILLRIDYCRYFILFISRIFTKWIKKEISPEIHSFCPSKEDNLQDLALNLLRLSLYYIV